MWLSGFPLQKLHSSRVPFVGRQIFNLQPFQNQPSLAPGHTAPGCSLKQAQMQEEHVSWRKGALSELLEVAVTHCYTRIGSSQAAKLFLIFQMHCAVLFLMLLFSHFHWIQRVGFLPKMDLGGDIASLGALWKFLWDHSSYESFII